MTKLEHMTKEFVERWSPIHQWMSNDKEALEQEMLADLDKIIAGARKQEGEIVVCTYCQKQFEW